MCGWLVLQQNVGVVTLSITHDYLVPSLSFNVSRSSGNSRLILHTPGPEIPDLAYHIHSLLTLLTQLLTLLSTQAYDTSMISAEMAVNGSLYSR